MNYKVVAGSKKRAISRGKIVQGKAIGTPLRGVHESSPYGRGMDQSVEWMLSDIVARLERIEEKIDESVYPPESAIKPSSVRRVKKAQADIASGKGKTHDSMDDFIRAISE
jgi:hypothetical protein